MKNNEWKSTESIPKDYSLFEAKIRDDQEEIIRTAWWWGPPLLSGGDDDCIATTKGVYSLNSVLGWRKKK